MTKVEELINESPLTSEQLFTLKETLKGTEFIKIEDLWFGFLTKREYSVTYGWGDGTGHHNHNITTYSDVLLIDRCDKTDAFTGKSLEDSWSSHVEDMGHNGGSIQVVFFKENPSLGEQARRHKVYHQSVYRQCEMGLLLTTYLECIKNISMGLTAGDKNVALPNYQYELVGGVVKTLKPLNYHELK